MLKSLPFIPKKINEDIGTRKASDYSKQCTYGGYDTLDGLFTIIVMERIFMDRDVGAHKGTCTQTMVKT